METAIQVVWWIGLLGALAATLVLLKEIALIVRTLRDILHLAGSTREAASAIPAAFEDVAVLDRLGEAAGGIDVAARKASAAASSSARTLAALEPESSTEGG